MFYFTKGTKEELTSAIFKFLVALDQDILLEDAASNDNVSKSTLTSPKRDNAGRSRCNFLFIYVPMTEF